MIAVSIPVASADSSAAEGVLPAQWPDCVADDAEYCVETLAFTPFGATVEERFDDAVPATADGSAHPNMYVSISSTGSVGVYGKTLSSLSFEVTDPTSRMLGAVTRSGIPAGSYRLVLRTGGHRPHSMSIKGRPVGDDPFTVTKGADGNYTWELSAMSEAFVTMMDSTKWSACRSAGVDPICEADTAFVKKLSGIVVLVPPNYAETVVSPVSPSVDISQGLWVASNTMVLDALPEMNLITKSLSLPAYGPHYVPVDFPVDGLTQEGSRHLNPAYFEAFVPNDLAAFMANFAVADVAAKLPAAVKTTVESAGAAGAGVTEVEHPHALTITPAGGRVRVLISHYSAPNPRVYVGATSVGGAPRALDPGGASLPPSPSTSPTSSVAPSSGGQLSTPVLRKGRSFAASVIARRAGIVVPKKARPGLAKTKQRSCRVVLGKVRTVRAGVCRLNLAVSNRSGMIAAYTVTVTVR